MKSIPITEAKRRRNISLPNMERKPIMEQMGEIESQAKELLRLCDESNTQVDLALSHLLGSPVRIFSKKPNA